MNVSVDLARELLDMGARLRRSGDDDAHSSQADEQLCGAVAMHNILQREGVAYLADEVGMGKTYVALGAIALFRHFNPQFRVAVIAPRENIQAKWMKEWLNFATYIARVPDLRVQALHGGPARPLARCDNLQQFIRETTVNPHRDFFLRLSSFSLGTGDAEEDVRALRSRFQRELPWLEDAVTSLRKREFKDNLAIALCCALPEFDLLVVDEAHNLKHGFAERIQVRRQPKPANASATPTALEYETLFTALRLPEWRALKSAVWPDPVSSDFEEAFRERELRRELFGAMARLGNPVIDLYIVAMCQRQTLKTRAAQATDALLDSEADEQSYIPAVLAMLEQQRLNLSTDRQWRAFSELAAAAEHFDLILDVNEPNARTKPLAEAGHLFGTVLLRQQQPVGGMTGQVSRTLVRQFRMPGYPFVLLSTDLLQEGEDLHTFCSDVYHYGLAWTPSAVEQRIGRIDRVRSKTERTAMAGDVLPDESRLQVFYPHLEDTVERLQVRRVLRRMHEFIRLMHEGLSGAPQESSKLNVSQEIVGAADIPPPVSTPLTTAFPVQDSDLSGRRRGLAVTADVSAGVVARLRRIGDLRELAGLQVIWDQSLDACSLPGTVTWPSGRRQHFELQLDTFGEHLVMRCISPVGRLDTDEIFEEVRRLSRRVAEQLGIIEEADDRGVDLTVEEEVLLGEPTSDSARIAWLVGRVVTSADRIEETLWHGRDGTLDSVSSVMTRA